MPTYPTDIELRDTDSRLLGSAEHRDDVWRSACALCDWRTEADSKYASYSGVVYELVEHLGEDH